MNGLIAGVAIFAVGYWVGRGTPRVTMGTFMAPPISNQCCPSNASMTKNNRCHDGRRFVKMIPCARRLSMRRVGVPEPFPKARW